MGAGQSSLNWLSKTRSAVALAQAQVASEMQKSAVAKDSEIQALKAKLDAGELARKLAAPCA